MENLYFKGLEKALMDGCYIKVFSCSLRYPVARVEKIDKENNITKLVSYSENGNVLSCLNSASNNIIDEFSSKCDKRILCDRLRIDDYVDMGYTLHFYKLSNNQILSTLCTNLDGKYVPIKSVITPDLKSGFDSLNTSLSVFDNKENLFDNFVLLNSLPVYEHQKKLKNN